MASDWNGYQEEAAEFFRSLGLEANTNVTLKGVRTTHDVDVLVKSCHAGFEVTWIVECKHWNSRVSKLHVLALREIVTDTGSDRGILLAEKGFQRGAAEAAVLGSAHHGDALPPPPSGLGCCGPLACSLAFCSA